MGGVLDAFYVWVWDCETWLIEDVFYGVFGAEDAARLLDELRSQGVVAEVTAAQIPKPAPKVAHPLSTHAKNKTPTQ